MKKLNTNSCDNIIDVISSDLLYCVSPSYLAFIHWYHLARNRMRDVYAYVTNMSTFTTLTPGSPVLAVAGTFDNLCLIEIDLQSELVVPTILWSRHSSSTFLANSS